VVRGEPGATARAARRNGAAIGLRLGMSILPLISILYLNGPDTKAALGLAEPSAA
jgi:hypothetical protein